jgi:hypothetical protein
VAELLHALGRDDEAYAHWAEASEILFRPRMIERMFLHPRFRPKRNCSPTIS